MTMNFKLNKFKDDIGFDVKDMEDVLRILRNSVDYLKYHNKNLTKRQDVAVDNIACMLDCLTQDDVDFASHEVKIFAIFE